jgi:oxygen-independent coproporphyrinogen-3 oxidase
VTEDRTELTPALLAEDALVFGLRMNEGVDVRRLQATCPQAPWDTVDAFLMRLVEEGLATRDSDRVRLTSKGRLLADQVGSEVMMAFDRAPGARPVIA